MELASAVPCRPSEPPFATVNGESLTVGDVAFVREVKQDGCPVRKVQVLAENGPVLTLDTFSAQDNDWMNQPVYADVRRLELIYRPVSHPAEPPQAKADAQKPDTYPFES